MPGRPTNEPPTTSRSACSPPRTPRPPPSTSSSTWTVRSTPRSTRTQTGARGRRRPGGRPALQDRCSRPTAGRQRQHAARPPAAAIRMVRSASTPPPWSQPPPYAGPHGHRRPGDAAVPHRRAAVGRRRSSAPATYSSRRWTRWRRGRRARSRSTAQLLRPAPPTSGRSRRLLTAARAHVRPVLLPRRHVYTVDGAAHDEDHEVQDRRQPQRRRRHPHQRAQPRGRRRA